MEYFWFSFDPVLKTYFSFFSCVNLTVVYDLIVFLHLLYQLHLAQLHVLQKILKVLLQQLNTYLKQVREFTLKFQGHIKKNVFATEMPHNHKRGICTK